MAVTRVKTQDIGDGSVATADLAAGAVTFVKLASAAVSGLKDAGSGSIALDLSGNHFEYTGNTVGLKLDTAGGLLASAAGVALNVDGSSGGLANGTLYTPGNGLKNLLINGAFELWQRGTIFTAPASNTFTADRWVVSGGFGGTFNAEISNDFDIGEGDSTTCLKVTTNAADTTVGANDHWLVSQNIEGYTFRKVHRKRMILSFYAKSSLGGTYCVAFRNLSGNRSYVATYSLSANTWTRVRIPLLGDQTGTWFLDNNIGLRVSFCLICGSSFHTTAGSWQTGNYLATSAQANLAGATSRTWQLANVQLEQGYFASNFDYRPLSVEMALAQRYFEKSYLIDQAPGTANALGGIVLIATSSLASGVAGGVAAAPALGFKVEKRASPTVVLYDYDGTANAVRIYPTDAKRIGVSVAGQTATGTVQYLFFNNTGAVALSAGNICNAHWTADAELT